MYYIQVLTVVNRNVSDNVDNRRSSIALSELKSAGLQQNKLSSLDNNAIGDSGISWIASENNKENQSYKENQNSNSEIVDHIPKPFYPRPSEIKKQKQNKKQYDINITSINSAIYDENWATKQSNSFTEWMNFTFSSSLESSPLVADDAMKVSSDGSNTMEGNANGLKILLQKRNEAINRQKCFQLYQSEVVMNALKSIEEEICEGRLLMREDRDILADLGLQEELFSLIFSYEMPWIRLGLEIVFGEIISVHMPSTKQGTNGNSNQISSTPYPCKSNCPKWKNAIKTFVLERMLSNPDIVAQYSKQQLLCVPHEKKMKEQIRQHIMKKFLSLILLLDNAKKNVILLLPTLFVKDAPIKSSKEIGR